MDRPERINRVGGKNSYRMHTDAIREAESIGMHPEWIQKGVEGLIKNILYAATVDRENPCGEYSTFDNFQ